MNTPQTIQDVIEKIISELAHKEGALLPILHAIQNQFGYIPEQQVAFIAKKLNLSRAEVYGVISFYHEFHLHDGSQSRVKNIVQVCRAEACQAMGARALESHAKSTLGIDYGETTSDGLITLEPVYCLGNCACSPSVRINDDIYARVDNTRFDELVNNLVREVEK